MFKFQKKSFLCVNENVLAREKGSVEEKSYLQVYGMFCWGL